MDGSAFSEIPLNSFQNNQAEVVKLTGKAPPKNILTIEYAGWAAQSK
jgi:hypothetical protein